MATNPVRSIRHEKRLIVGELRAQQRTWVEVAGVLRDRYGANMRVALREAHGWSQPQAAEQWNDRWPAEPKTFKAFSSWELWPGPTGHAPSHDVLARLAELYECAVADLLADAPTFRDRDTAHQAQAHMALLPNGDSMLGLDALGERLERMDAEELAEVVAAWASQSGSGVSRRSLLKLSAGLTLAAADPLFALAEPASAALAPAEGEKHSGIWLSRYVYPSSGRGADYVGEHYVVVRQRGTRLTGRSLPHTTGSRLELDLELKADRPIVEGSWTEHTSPTGYYKGVVYHGTLQMVIDKAGHVMSGQWLGFGKDFKINSGAWELHWVDGSTSARATREYALKI
jgi:hypothetical protein